MGWWQWPAYSGASGHGPSKQKRRRNSGGGNWNGYGRVNGESAGGYGRRMVVCQVCPAGLSSVRASRVANGKLIDCVFGKTPFDLGTVVFDEAEGAADNMDVDGSEKPVASHKVALASKDLLDQVKQLEGLQALG